MSKLRTVWYCNECGHKQPKWSGQCPACDGWNTLHEEVEAPPSSRRFESQRLEPAKPIRLQEISNLAIPRHKSGIGEFDRLVGGGIVIGSLTLVGGEPGVGKSTLLLQLSAALASQGLKVLYICAEESVEQTGDRARRLGMEPEQLYFLSETSFTLIQKQIELLDPAIVIVD